MTDTTTPADEREAFEAAFNDAMGATDMPPDGFPGYDEWLFKRGWQARASQPAQEPVAWMRDAGEPSLSTMTHCIPETVRQVWLKANPMQVERYTIPLYAAPQVQQEPVAWGLPNSSITGTVALMSVRLEVPSDDQYGGAKWIPLYAAPPADDEAVRLLEMARKALNNSPAKDAIDAYLAKVGK